MENEKYIIVEVIPEAISPEKGNLAQLSALMIDEIKLIGRFDYRLKEELVKNPDIRDITSYDKDDFTYVESTQEILEKFKKWSKKIKLLILDNEYTNNFLNDINNKKEFIGRYFDIEYSDDFIDKVIEKYKLQPSNYIVDLLYEAMIYESNNNKVS